MTQNDTEERWRPVLCWEGFYEVSDYGRVRSVARWVAARDGRRLIDGRVLMPQLDIYFRITLCNGETQKPAHIHRLVAEAFVAGCGPVVRHLDGDPQNNHWRNLAWGTYQDNESDKARHGRVPQGLKHSRSRVSSDQLHAIRSMHARGLSQLAIAKDTGINRGTIGYIVRGESYVND